MAEHSVLNRPSIFRRQMASIKEGRGHISLEEREKNERRAQRTEKQRHPKNKRAAKKTAQMHFRCSPKFHEDAKAYAAHANRSVSDIMEEALELLMKQKGFNRG